MKKPQLTLDQAQLWQMGGELDGPTARQRRAVVVGWVSLWLIPLVIRPEVAWLAHLCVTAIVCVAVATAFIALDEAIAASKRSRIMDKCEWYPPAWQIFAHQTYGWGIDSYLAMWECREAHLPGDCPLCGAE